MALYKIKMQGLWLILLISSCSNGIVGYYSYNKTDAINQYHLSITTTKHLELYKDSSFNYTESYQKNWSGGLKDVPYVYLGKGRYMVSQKKLILNFEPKIRKIYKIDQVALSLDELSELRKNRGDSTPIDKDKIYITCQIFPDDNFFHISPDKYIGYTTINHVSSLFGFRQALIEYYKAQFPLELVFDFGNISVQYAIPYFGNKTPEDNKPFQEFSGTTFGFLDERIQIQKPENLKINIHLSSPDSLTEQVFIGKRILAVETSTGNISIGEMTKIKKKKVKGNYNLRSKENNK